MTWKLSYLQTAYQNASISFRLEGITRQFNATWSRNGDEMGMKSALREGTYSTLNVYFHADLQESPLGATRHTPGIDGRQMLSSSELSSNVLGFCTLPDPSINGNSSRPSYVKDGCNILAQTMPGGLLSNYNRGGTAIHEIGHWNGLLHTFEGESCSPDDDGDYIEDTPQESRPTDGCPSRKNSCPNRPGVDPIHNFMDYSTDICYEVSEQECNRGIKRWNADILGRSLRMGRRGGCIRCSTSTVLRRSLMRREGGREVRVWPENGE